MKTHDKKGGRDSLNHGKEDKKSPETEKGENDQKEQIDEKELNEVDVINGNGVIPTNGHFEQNLNGGLAVHQTVEPIGSSAA